MRGATILALMLGGILAAATASLSEISLPIAGLSAGDLRDMFNENRGGHAHEAIDVQAPRGTPVHAVAPGQVRKLFLSKAGGLTVYQFDDASDYCYYYAHLDRYADGLKEGMRIERGDVIGFVGSSGNANPDTPHLHFAVFELGPAKEWWKGTAINPYPALIAAAKRGK